MTSWHLGTMGFSYEGWRGVFYPEDVAPRSYLAHYSQVLDAVEIDSTFYGSPRQSTVKRWAAQTPADFQICPKTPRQITHEQQLSLEAGAGEAMDRFLQTVRLLGGRLGPVLVQLPPSFTAAASNKLETFLAHLPPDLRYAVEFRDSSWYTPETVALLSERGVAWVALDYLALPKEIHLTADFLYIRWIGTHGRFPTQDREYLDPSPRLAWWWEQLQPHLAQVRSVYGFFNDDYAGHSPATCNRFKAMAGLPVNRPEIPQQGSLF